MTRSGLSIACLVTLTAAPVAAHHSYVEFDQQKSRDRSVTA
jgi:hypothetical protein